MHRLDKLVSHTLSLSRKEVKDLLKTKRISLNGNIIVDGSIKASSDDIICLDETRLDCFPAEVIMVHKPQGVVCSTQDAYYPTVYEYFEISSKHYHMIGRLDQDTTGLLLLTTNGQLTHQLMSPNKKVNKHYIVTLDRDIEDESIQLLEKGVDIQDDTICEPAQVVKMSSNVIELIIHEGRYHQVKRMLSAVGYNVLALHRSHIGGLSLDGLALGQQRALTQSEIHRLKEKHTS